LLLRWSRRHMHEYTEQQNDENNRTVRNRWHVKMKKEWMINMTLGLNAQTCMGRRYKEIHKYCTSMQCNVTNATPTHYSTVTISCHRKRIEPSLSKHQFNPMLHLAHSHRFANLVDSLPVLLGTLLGLTLLSPRLDSHSHFLDWAHSSTYCRIWCVYGNMRKKKRRVNMHHVHALRVDACRPLRKCWRGRADDSTGLGSKFWSRKTHDSLRSKISPHQQQQPVA
jgi:hypothetical protein